MYKLLIGGSIPVKEIKGALHEFEIEVFIQKKPIENFFIDFASDRFKS
jgi:hypothetical protein